MAIENVRYAVGVAALSDYETYGELVDALNNPALAFWFDEEQEAYDKAITASQENPVTYTKVTRFQDGAAVGIPVFIICGSLTLQDFE
jgi:hypothetical protein